MDHQQNKKKRWEQRNDSSPACEGELHTWPYQVIVREWAGMVCKTGCCLFYLYLVGGFTHLEQYESQWGWDYPIYEMENKIHVWNHQPLMVLEPSINPRLFRCEQKGWFWPIPMGIITRLPFGPRCMQCQTQGSFSQGPFQDPKMEVPTVYKAYIRPKFQGISLQNKALYGTVPPF